MKVKLNDEQILQLAANAVNAASPMGFGFLHFENKEYQPEDMRASVSNGYIDYFNGRMTKLALIKEDNEWVFPDTDPHIEYQSWASTYPTYQSLIESVQNGI